MRRFLIGLLFDKCGEEQDDDDDDEDEQDDEADGDDDVGIEITGVIEEEDAATNGDEIDVAEEGVAVDVIKLFK